VFAGGATLAAITRVCPTDTATVHALADKSLLYARELAGETRFGMLEVIREYAFSRSRDSTDVDARDELHARHAEYFAAMADAAANGLRGADQLDWLVRLDVEHDNLRAALTWALAHSEVSIAGRLATGLWPFWRARGLYRDGRGWLDQVLAFGSEVPLGLRANALNGAGVLALLQTDFATAFDQLSEACAAFVTLGDGFGQAWALSNLGWLARNREERVRAQELFEASLQLRRDIGDRWGEAWTLNNLGVVALDR
jgi:hypothetical protein